MKTLSPSLWIAVLGAVGIGLALTIASFAQAPAPNSYVLVLKDYVPVRDKAKFEAAMRKNTKDKMKWKDEQGRTTDVPSIAANLPRTQDIQTTAVQTLGPAERAPLGTIAVHVTIQSSFNTAAGLKEVVDTLQ